jgi:RHS repeat-associated protein
VIWTWPGAKDASGNFLSYTVNFYTPSGQKLGAYTMSPTTYNGSAVLNVTLTSSDQYFGGRRLKVMDQLGSAGVYPNAPSYFPWGEARGSNPQDTWNYATYWQDSVSGLDYANNRYYFNITGSFITPDPSISSQDPWVERRHPLASGPLQFSTRF